VVAKSPILLPGNKDVKDNKSVKSFNWIKIAPATLEENVAKGIEAEKKITELQALLQEKVLASNAEVLARINAALVL
jgi:hypothetical protein